jgi:hypothetical protein
VLVDRVHLVAERYGIVNVPMSVWIDEEGAVARAPVVAPGDDTFIDFTGVGAEVHHEQLRRWVTHGEVPPDSVARGPEPIAAERALARAEWRLGAHLHRAGRDAEAEAHFRRAAELAPDDWTIRRGSFPLRGIDPFLSDEFIELYSTWDAAGRPGYRSPEA